MADKKLNIFDILKKIDQGDHSAYSKYSDDERKELDSVISYPILRWLSCATDRSDQANALLMTNEFVNPGYFELSKHKELQYKLCTVAGLRKFTKRGYIKPPPTKNSNKVFEVIRTAYPLMKDDEVQLWIDVNGKLGLFQLFEQLGLNTDDLKSLETEIENLWPNHNTD